MPRRRDFMHGLFTGALWTLLSVMPSHASPSAEVTFRIRRLFGRSHAIRRLARRLDTATGPDAGAAFPDLIDTPSSDLRRMTDEQLLREIKTTMRDDFRHGRVVSIDGWCISRTELAILRLFA